MMSQRRFLWSTCLQPPVCRSTTRLRPSLASPAPARRPITVVSLPVKRLLAKFFVFPSSFQVTFPSCSETMSLSVLVLKQTVKHLVLAPTRISAILVRLSFSSLSKTELLCISVSGSSPVTPIISELASKSTSSLLMAATRQQVVPLNQSPTRSFE